MFHYCRYKHLSVAPPQIVTLSNVIEHEVDGATFRGAFVPLESTAVSYTDMSNLLPGFMGFPLFIATNLAATDVKEQVRVFPFTTNVRVP